MLSHTFCSKIGRVMILLVASQVAYLASAGTVKKWVDANGKVHFGDAPPDYARAQDLEVKNQKIVVQPDKKIVAPLQTKQERLQAQTAAQKKQAQEERKKRTAAAKALATELKKDYHNWY